MGKCIYCGAMLELGSNSQLCDLCSADYAEMLACLTSPHCQVRVYHPCDRPGCDELTADISGLCSGCLADEKAEQLDYLAERDATRYGGAL
jgi:hypothetical protein